MANTFLKPTVINRMALKLLQREVVLPRLVWNFADAEFRGAYGDTVTLRLPAVLAAREYGFRNNRSSEIVIDDLTETSVPVVLDTDLYSAVALTDEQLTLDIVDFSEQVLNPQVSAIARGLEDLIVETMQSATYGTSLNIADSADGMWGTLLDARKALNDANVPREGRVVVVGSEIEREILSDDKFNRVDSVGDGAVSAVREATINRLAGFTIVGSNAIDAETAIAFHPTAFAFVNVAPVVPDGANFGSRMAESGLAMRWLRDYDAPHLQDRSVVSSFAGCSSVEDDGTTNVRAVRINFQGGS
ncbi:MAG TPA: P22 phage major capsid protein family protein [Ilumatobacteraceae bacterium]|nr:hypothetical protein [Ilumatobacteraceae bacterium]HQZ36325.1 P22 phage major capsid protein family protein [Ilumatobacteraceae bacterium]